MGGYSTRAKQHLKLRAEPRSASHARKATIAPCDQTGPRTHGAARPVPMEKPRKRSALTSLLTQRSSALTHETMSSAPCPCQNGNEKENIRAIFFQATP